MGKINVIRVILGGIVAGIAIDLLDYPIDGIWLANSWHNNLKALGHTDFGSGQIVLFNLIGLLTGIAAIWVYAGIRPRFGPGVKTAIYAGLAVWVIGVLLPNVGFMYVTGLFSKHLTMWTTLGALVEVAVGTICGASVYKEA
jgi:hypothetical protein